MTVKLLRAGVTRIVEATEVSIYSVGTPDPSVIAPKDLPTAKIRAISVTRHSGGLSLFYVSNGPVNRETCTDNISEVEITEVFDCAYIENAHGATTEKVHAY